MADKKKAELAERMLAEAAENPINENVVKRIVELMKDQKKDEKSFWEASEKIAERMMHNNYMAQMSAANKVRFDAIVGSDGRITIPQATMMLHDIMAGAILTVEIANWRNNDKKKPKV